jgi:transposase
MFTREEDVDAHALRRQGWSISAIARHLGRDRKTIRAHLEERREPGVRARDDDPFAAFVAYVRQRLRDDPHLRASVLDRELRELGFDASYQTLTREIRARDLRPRCDACGGPKRAATIEIDHPPGEETQWDWLELPDAPWGGTALIQVGALAQSGKLAGRFSESMDAPHLIQAMDGVIRRLGGLTKVWRVDRMQGAVIPGTDRLCAAFADAAKYYGVGVIVCPPRRAKRKGVVEAANDYLTQSWWRTADVSSPEQAQRSLDRFCTHVADRRPRHGGTVIDLARAEPLRPVPAEPYPCVVEVKRSVSWGALVSFEGNRYSVPPEFIDGHVLVHAPLGARHIELRSLQGAMLRRHLRRPAGAGALVRTDSDRAALERIVLSEFTTAPPCRRKPNNPPSDQAKAIAAGLRSAHDAAGSPQADDDGSAHPEATRPNAERSTVVSLQRYADWASS